MNAAGRVGGIQVRGNRRHGVLEEQMTSSHSALKPNSYDYKGRFASYWRQISEVEMLTSGRRPHLEVGPGTGFLTERLRERGHEIQTLDIDEASCPDIKASVLSIPVEDNYFDTVSAFEVLEHLPFDSFRPALFELSRVSQSGVVISVPDVRYCLDVSVAILSNAQEFGRVFSFPRIFNRKLPPYTPGGHYWEIGRPGYPLRQLLKAIPEQLHLIRDYRVPGNSIHHFFVMKPRGNKG